MRLSSPGNIILYLSISLIIFFVFFPCLHAGFINFDDPVHFLENHAVLGLSSDFFKVIFTQTINTTYIPLTTLSFALEHYFFGFNQFVFHFDNLLLHAVDVLLVLCLARRMGLSNLAAFLAAVAFGINPMKVESVAWVTERKDVLYALFYLLALHQYLSYLKTKSIGTYLGTLLLGFISMLAKPMALSLPLVLLLFDWFQGRRWDRTVFLEKIPFLLYVAEIGSLSYLFNLKNPVGDALQGALIWVWSFNYYILKFLWPWHISFVYLRPQPVALTNWAYLSSIGLFMLIVAVLARRRNNRILVFAFLYYFLSIFFLLFFNDKVVYSGVSDRFMYLPCLGICLGIGVAVEQMLVSKKLIVVFIMVLVLFWGGKTFHQCRIWQNSITFWDEVVRDYPKSYPCYYYRGNAYMTAGQNVLAMSDLSKAIELNPKCYYAYNNRAALYYSMAEYNKALADINRAIAIDPSNLNDYVTRAEIEEKSKEFSWAIKDLMYVQQSTGVSFVTEIKRLEDENK